MRDGRDGKRGMSPATRVLALGAVGAVLVLGGLELAARVLGLASPLPEEHADFDPVGLLPWKYEPNVDGRNALGFRGPDREIRKPPGTFRIVGVGGGFTYGSGQGIDTAVPYEATFLARLEAALTERGGPPVEAINLGIPGYWPEPDALVLRHHGLHYQPDLVLALVTPNNFHNTASGSTRRVGHEYMLSSRARHMGGLGWLLYRRSHVARVFFAHPLARARDRERNAGDREEDDPEIVWAWMQDAWGRMVDMTRAAGVRIVFVQIPSVPRMHRQGDDPAERSRRLRQVCATRNCSVTDVLPAFKGHPAPETLLHSDGRNYSEAGYALVADVILRDLEARGLLPDELMPFPAGRSTEEPAGRAR